MTVLSCTSTDAGLAAKFEEEKVEVNPLNAVTIYTLNFPPSRQPYMYANDNFVCFLRKAKKLNEMRVGPSMVSANVARPHLRTDIVWKDSQGRVSMLVTSTVKN